MRICKRCGHKFRGWFCPECSKRRSRHRATSRRWNVASARARMLGGWDQPTEPELGDEERNAETR